MDKRKETVDKIQKILTDRKTLSAGAAFVLIYVLWVAFWRREKQNRERQIKIYGKIEKAENKGNELGVTEEERREFARYVVEQDLSGRLPALIRQILERLRREKERLEI